MRDVLLLVGLLSAAVSVGILVAWLIPKGQPGTAKPMHCPSCRAFIANVFEQPREIHCPHCHSVSKSPQWFIFFWWPF